MKLLIATSINARLSQVLSPLPSLCIWSTIISLWSLPRYVNKKQNHLKRCNSTAPYHNIKLTELVNGKKSSTPLYSPDLFSTKTLWSCTQPWHMFFKWSEFKASRMSLKMSVICCKERTSLNFSASYQTREHVHSKHSLTTLTASDTFFLVAVILPLVN